jgi:uncharacterized membrane protein YhfC
MTFSKNISMDEANDIALITVSFGCISVEIYTYKLLFLVTCSIHNQANVKPMVFAKTSTTPGYHAHFERKDSKLLSFSRIWLVYMVKRITFILFQFLLTIKLLVILREKMVSFVYLLKSCIQISDIFSC